MSGYSIATNGLPDSATIKCSSGGLPLWTNSADYVATGIAADASGCISVTGISTAASSSDYVTIKYSDAGGPLWTNRYGGPGLSGGMPTAVAVDSGGDTFVTGYLYSYGGDSNYEYATVAYSNDGVPLWTNRYNGLANGADYAERIAVANDGSVIVMGYSWNGGFVSGYLSYDYVIIKYSSSVTPYLAIQQLDDQIVHNWTNSIFGLQIAPLITGTFTNLFGATSPYTKPLTGPQQYFRLAAPQ